MRKAFTAAGLGAAGLLLASGALAGGWVDVPADLEAPAGVQGSAPAAPAAGLPAVQAPAASAGSPAAVPSAAPANAAPAAAPLAAAPKPRIDVLPAAAGDPALRRSEPPRGPVREADRAAARDARSDPLGEALARALPGVPEARDEARRGETRRAGTSEQAREEPKVRERPGRSRSARSRRPNRDWDAAGYYRGRGVMRTRWGYARLVDNPNNDTRRPGVIEFIPGSGPRRR